MKTYDEDDDHCYNCNRSFENCKCDIEEEEEEEDDDDEDEYE